MNLATHAGLIAGTSVLTIASTGTAGDLDSVIDGIINDSATISGDDAMSMSGLFRYGFTNGEAYNNDSSDGDDDYNPGVGEASLRFEGEAGGFNYTMDYNLTGSGFYESEDGLNDYGFWYESDAGWGVGMGQFRSWANKANNVEAADSLAMENGYIGQILYAAGGYNDMVFAWYEADQFRGGIQLGDNEEDKAGGGQDHDFDVHYRAEFIAMGSWDQTDDFNSAAGTEQVLAFGFGGFEADADNIDVDGFVTFNGRHELTNYDVTYKNGAFGAHAAIGTIEFENGGDEVEFMTLQASYYFDDAMQFFATYESIELDPAGAVPAFDVDAMSPLTIGMNYWYGDDVKATVQYTNNQIDLDKTDGEGDGVLSAQVQFSF